MTTPAPISAGRATRIRLRRAWTEDWEAVNPILSDGEPGFDKTANMLKIGDGVTPWTELNFLTPPPTEDVVITGNAAIDNIMHAHLSDTTPHPIYDDGPSLLLLYLNAKV